MDRAAAHAALDALLDHLDLARTANSPEAHVAAEAEAHEAWQRLAAGVAGPMIARRLGAAWHGRHPDDPVGAHSASAAIETARMPLPPEAMAVPDNASRARLMLRRFLLDHAGLLSPGLATSAAKALHLLDEGETAGIAAPYHVPHAPKARGRRTMRDIAHLSRIYYRAGYFDSPLDAAAEAHLSSIDGPDGEREDWQKAWDRIQKARFRHKLASFAETHRRQGAHHRASGGAFSPPVGPGYSAEEVESLPLK